MGGTEEPTRRRWNVGAWKIPHADRDIAHQIITADDLRGYLDGMGSARPDDDTKFPVGSKVAYSVMLTDDEAELFRTASNVRYVELDVETTATAGNTVFPTGTAQKFMGVEFPGTDSWHGRDVNIAILDGGVTTAMRTYMGWTQVARQVFGGFTPGADEITTDHGCLVAPCAVPRGGRILDGIIADDAGGSNASLFLSGVTWAVDNGADIINYSYAGTGTTQAYNDAIEYAANGGAVIVASAGNRGVNAIDYPAQFCTTYSNIYSSANFDEVTGTLSSTSNFHVDMSGCAPGNLTLGMAPDSTPIRWSGTSASSPHMAGLVARAMTGGQFTAAQAAAALKSSARNTGAPAAQQGAGAWDLKAALTQLGAMPTAVPLRTNLCVNPSMETPSTTGYSLAAARAGITLGNSGTGTAVAGHAGPTYAFVNVTGDGSTSVNPDADLGGPTIAVTAGLPYTFSTHLRWGATQGRVRLLVRWRNSANAIISETLAPEEPLFSQSWTRYFITGTAPTGATQAQLRMQLFGATLTQAISFRWDAVHYEQSSSLGFYFDGATTPGGAWTGTAHASTSTVQVSTGTTFAGSASVAGAGAITANGTVGAGAITHVGAASVAGAGGVSANGTVGAPATMVDATNVAFTDSGGLAGQYHIYGAGLPGTGSGLVMYLHGDGDSQADTYEFSEPNTNYALSGNRGLIAVAKAKGYVLAVPRSPDTAGSITWWENGTRNATYAAELLDFLVATYQLDRSKIWLMGYSGGAGFISENFVPARGAATITSGGAVIVAGGDGAVDTPTGWTTAFKAAFPMHWVAGQLDDGTFDGEGFNALADAQAGRTYYSNQGFTTSITTPPAMDHDIDGMFGPVLDDYLPALAGFTPPSRTPGTTRPTLVTSYLDTDTGTTSLTTPAFTPAAGEVIVVKAWAASQNAPVFGECTANGYGLTFASKAHIPTTSGAVAYIFVAEVGATSPGSVSVTTSWHTASGAHGMVVERWSGGLVQSLLPQSSPVTGSGAPSASITPTNANSVITWLNLDKAAVSGTATYRSSATQTQSTTATIRAYAAYQNSTGTTSQTVGLSAPAGQNWALAGIELLPAPSTGSPTTHVGSASIAGAGAISANGTVGSANQTPAQILNIGPGAGQNHFNLGAGVGATHSDRTQAQIAGGLVLDPQFIQTADGQRVQFRVQLDAGTTGGSEYPRSELRELDQDGTTEAAWNSGSGDHQFSGTSTVTHLPPNKSWVCFTQIHDSSSDMARLQTEGTLAGGLKLVVRFTPDGGGQETTTTVRASYTVGTTVAWEWRHLNGALTLKLDGVQVFSANASRTGCYFKAGAYAQTNETIDSATEYVAVELTDLRQWHTGWPTPTGDAPATLAASASIAGSGGITANATGGTGPVVGAPTVNAGADALVTSGATWDSTATENDNGSAVTARTWTIVAAPPGITVPQQIGTAARLVVRLTVAGEYTLRYAATNAAGTGTDDAVVECVPAATAAPVFVAVGTAATGSTTSVAVPAPAGVAAGDFQICVIADAGEETISGVPAGWTLLDTVVPTSPGGDPGGTHSTWIYYNTTGSAASATWTKSGSRYFHAVRAAWRNQTALGEHTVVERASSTSTSISPVTPVRGSSLVVGVVVADLLNASAGPYTPQATATERYDATTVSGTERETIAIAEIVSPNGQVRNLTWNGSNADETAVYAFVLEGPFAQIPADVAIDGAGQVTANAAAAGTAASADIDGSGGVSANATPNRFVSASIDGDGQVTAATTASVADASASIAGVGQVSVAAPVSDVAVSASVAGAGTVSASSTVVPGGVGASVDGAGAVTAAATLVHSVSAAIAGAGSASEVGAGGVGGAFPGVAFPGEVFPGDTAAAAATTHVGSASITGDGAVSATTGGVQAAQATGAGAGAVSADSTLLQAVQASIAGDGAVSADLTVLETAQVTVAGDAAVSADLTLILPAQATVAGAGAVSATTGAIQAAQATVAGDGAVTGSADLVLAVQATVAGAAAVSADSTLILAVQATIGGDGTLAADLPLVLAAQATVAGAGAVSATTGAIQAAQATVAGDGAVTGSASLGAIEPALNLPAQATIVGAGVVDAHATVRTPPNTDIEIGGATPHVAFWAVHPDTGALAPLPHVTGFELSPVRNEPGSIRIDYPIVGKNYELLRAVVDQDVQLEIEIWVGGSANGRMRGLLLEAAGDDVAEDGAWTFAGHFLEYRAHDAVVAPDPTPGNDWETFFDNATPGVVVKTLWQAAQARGTLTDITTATFSTTHDSNGAPWSQAVYMSFAPHRHYDEILTDLVEAGVCEWEITADHELRLYEPGSRGVDLTLDTPPLVLRRGRNLREAQRKFSSRDAGTDLWAAGGEGLYDTFSDASARARLGRQVERAISANSIIDEGALAAYIQHKIGEVTRGALELTLEIVFGAGQPLPRAAVNLGDWLWTDTGRGTATSTGLEYYRVAQWTLSSDGDELRGTFSLNDLMSERVSRLEKLLKAVAGGTVVVGASVATPDAKPPAPPQGVGASSLAYVDDAGKTFAAVTASWQAVTTNADGTAMDDLSGYRIRYRYLNGGPPGWFDAGRVSSLFTSHVFSGVIAGSTIGIQVQAYDRTELESAWSAERTHVAAADSTAPPVPSPPGVTARLGVITVAWDGLGRSSEEMPADFSHVDVLYSTVADFTVTDAVYLDRFFAAGSTASAVAGYGQTVYVKLRSVDRSGNTSEMSTQGSVVVPRGIADDIADDIIGAAKLADGAVTGPKIAPEAVTTPHLSVAAFSDNLVPNGGFEDRSLTDPAQPAGWSVLSATGTTAATLRDVSAGNVDSGTASLKVSLSTASGEIRVGSKPIPVRPGDLVLLQARVKASRAVTGMRWRIYVWPGNPDTTPGAAAQVNAFNQFAVTTSFDTYEQQFTVPATLTVGTQAGAAPRFIQAVPAPGGVTGDNAALDVWFDEVRVRSVVGTAEIADAAIQRAKIANLAVGDAQIENASVGKLTAGTLSATVLLSGIIRTATSGARAELDAAGIRLYNSGNTNTVNLSATTGTASIVGTFTTGVTGRRIRISGADSEIQFFPEVGETRKGRIYSYVPNNFPNDVAMEMRAIDADGANRVARHWMLPTQQAMATAPIGAGGDLVDTASVRVNEDNIDISVSTLTTAPPYTEASQLIRARLQMTTIAIDAGVYQGADRVGGFMRLARQDPSGPDTVYGHEWAAADQNYINLSPATTDIEFYRRSLLKAKIGGVRSCFEEVGGFGPGERARINSEDGDSLVFYRQNNGQLTVGSADTGSFIGIIPASVKTFVIDHPLDPARHLVHGVTESPHAGVEYWSTTIVEDGEAVVDLPPYFEQLTRVEGRVVQLTVLAEDDPEDRRKLRRRKPRKAPPPPRPGLSDPRAGKEAPPPPPGLPMHVQATYPRDGKFTIWGYGSVDTFRVMWLVKAIRKDVPKLEVEPLKAAGAVRGDGPYTYFVPGGAS